jgi:hypothetical protein
VGSYEEADAIRDEFESQMASLRPTVPRAQNGAPFNGPAFDPAKDAVDSNNKPTLWVQLNLARGVAYRASMGPNARWRTPGQAVVKIMTPANKGFRTTEEVADDVMSIFRDLVLTISASETIVFRGGGPMVTPLGVNKEGWSQTNVSASYFRDEHI